MDDTVWRRDRGPQHVAAVHGRRARRRNPQHRPPRAQRVRCGRAGGPRAHRDAAAAGGAPPRGRLGADAGAQHAVDVAARRAVLRPARIAARADAGAVADARALLDAAVRARGGRGVVLRRIRLARAHVTRRGPPGGIPRARLGSQPGRHRSRRAAAVGDPGRLRLRKDPPRVLPAIRAPAATAAERGPGPDDASAGVLGDRHAHHRAVPVRARVRGAPPAGAAALVAPHPQRVVQPQRGAGPPPLPPRRACEAT
mmetsp:Transcript_37128/g.114661  ORF Transcript_37128/g.114661 Transcript_37128/m.114661 type:complete len:255 (-) Transcript_37128:777-1541(-)